MNSLYDNYFKNKDFYKGMAEVMLDIRKNKIAEQEVRQLTDELLKNNLIQDVSAFDKKAKSHWNEDYVTYLMNGMGSGMISKDYLIFYAEVTRAVRKKRLNRKLFAGVGITVMIIVGIIIFLDK